MTVEISNWKDLVEQFGFSDKDGYFGAKTIHKNLKELEATAEDKEHIAVEYAPTKSEGICLFFLVKTDGQKAFYEYRGTAG